MVWRGMVAPLAPGALADSAHVLGLQVTKQGAGAIDVYSALTTKQFVEPPRFALGTHCTYMHNAVLDR
jgi:hypothetical protein